MCEVRNELVFFLCLDPKILIEAPIVTLERSFFDKRGSKNDEKIKKKR